jgi:hypothetical protein
MASIASRLIDIYVDGWYYLDRFLHFLEPAWVGEFINPSEDEDTDDEDCTPTKPMDGWRLVYSSVQKDERVVYYQMALMEDGREQYRKSYYMMAGGTFDYSTAARCATHPQIDNIKVMPLPDGGVEQCRDTLQALAGYTGDFHKTGVPSLEDLKELWPTTFSSDITKIIVNMDNMDEYLIK